MTRECACLQYTVLVDSVRRALDFITETMSAADDEEGLALSTLERLDQELTEAHTGLTAKVCHPVHFPLANIVLVCVIGPCFMFEACTIVFWSVIG